MQLTPLPTRYVVVGLMKVYPRNLLELIDTFSDEETCLEYLYALRWPERSGRRGRGAEGKTLVLIAVENKEGKIGRIRLSPICNASGAVLTDAVIQMVSVGSVIRTDGWDGYNALSSYGYIHLPSCNDSIKATDVIPMPHLVAALLKRWLLGIHQGAISDKNLAYYLDEFTFRFNRRTSCSRGKLFYRLVNHALNLEPVPAKLFADVYRK